ncbi:hypothetical protein TEA_010265 [Camellia sinensis var. sinensis]|uniref:SIS domain-containing protein n=1 Tax=Camellia sinensis var. sinensis TaxID=542762 RepID=A0A4S4DGL3_CAMSN|nr:hypothetical protein TEA_010265 [Camellia sinensis var. sinensis]
MEKVKHWWKAASMDGAASILRPASVQRALSILEMEVEQINEGNYEHYMQKEIHEQPKSLTTTMRGILIQAGIPVTMEVASDLLDRNTHCGVHINAGAEIGVASTKAYTSQIVVMAMVALAIGGDTISCQARREAIIDGLFELPSEVREVLKLDQEMKDFAKLLIAEQSLLVFAGGYNYATALEGALKVKEVALMHSEGILAGEMKHGPLASVDENLPIVVIATRDATLVSFYKQQSVIQQLHAHKGRLVVMCSKGDAASVSVGGTCRVIEVPQVEDCLQPVINVVPLQSPGALARNFDLFKIFVKKLSLLAYHLTVLRGYNVDQPHNLAKSVTTQ